MFQLSYFPWEKLALTAYIDIIMQGSYNKDYNDWLKFEFNCNLNYDTMYLEFATLEDLVYFKLMVC